MTEPQEAKREEAPWESHALPSRKRLIRKALPILGITVLVLAVIWGLWPKPIVVETGLAGRQSLTVQISEEGKTRIRNRYLVAAPAAGSMKRVELKPGDKVVAGETVLTTIQPVASPLLDPRARLQAQAAVAASEARRDQVSQSFSAAKLAMDLAVAELGRARSVKESGRLSKSAMDRLESEAAIKAAEVRAAEFSLKVLDFEIAQAKAMLERPSGGGAEVIEVTSPVSGVVLKVLQESETIVSPGMPVLEVGDPEDLEIEAEILSRDAVAIKVGDSVAIDHWGGELALSGRVRRVEPAAFTKISALGVEEQRVVVLIDLVDPPEAARALGDRFRVEVQVAVWHSDDVLVVPSGSLFREGNDWKTYRYDDGEAVLTTIAVGHSDGLYTEIESGLAEGDKILLHPPDVVVDGSSVVER